ncbi:MAG TPA: HlyD family efflux transporter periplasmic adaptor subunit [Holophagaceae bacterium]|nr:HlyD family efflux transporter periplasmic adaptor subunit [Holophagaceae bacterium]
MDMPTPRTLKRALAWTGGLAALALLAWAFRPASLPVDVARVVRGPFEQELVQEGRTRARERFVVSAPVAGHLLRILLKPGDAVRRGDRLATLLPADAPLRDLRTERDLDARVGAAEAALARATAQRQQAEAARDEAARVLDRTRKLVAGKALTRADLDRAEADARIQEEAARAAGEEVHGQTHALESARAARASYSGGRERQEVRAALDGHVLRVHQESEAVVAAGTPLLELGREGDLEVVVDLLSSDAVQVAPGAKVRLEQWGGEGFLQAHVRRVEPGAFTKVSPLGVEEQRVNVIVDLDGEPARWAALGDGYRVEAHLETFAAPDLLKVPTAALFRDSQGWAVFVLEGGRARRRAVAIGHRQDREAEVKDGLKAGEAVILYPGETVAEGLRVAPRNAD